MGNTADSLNRFTISINLLCGDKRADHPTLRKAILDCATSIFAKEGIPVVACGDDKADYEYEIYIEPVRSSTTYQPGYYVPGVCTEDGCSGGHNVPGGYVTTSFHYYTFQVKDLKHNNDVIWQVEASSLGGILISPSRNHLKVIEGAVKKFIEYSKKPVYFDGEPMKRHGDYYVHSKLSDKVDKNINKKGGDEWLKSITDGIDSLDKKIPLSNKKTDAEIEFNLSRELSTVSRQKPDPMDLRAGDVIVKRLPDYVFPDGVKDMYVSFDVVDNGGGTFAQERQSGLQEMMTKVLTQRGYRIMGFRKFGDNIPSGAKYDFDVSIMLKRFFVRRVGKKFIWKMKSLCHFFSPEKDDYVLKIILTGDEFFVETYTDSMLLQNARKLADKISEEIDR